MIVPVGDLDRASVRALNYARSLSSYVTAVHVQADDEEDTGAFEARWEDRFPELPLVILESPYRTLQAPLMAYLDTLTIPAGLPLTVVLPEVVTKHWWEQYLHNRTAFGLREALRHREDTVVVSVPAHLE